LRELGWKKTKHRYVRGQDPDWCWVKGGAQHPKRVMVERTSSGGVRVFYETDRPEPPPF
jgi:hypothetical protein